MTVFTFRKTMTLTEFKEAYDKAVKKLHPEIVTGKQSYL